MNKFFVCLQSFILVILQSCVYEPQEVHYIRVNEDGGPPQIQVMELSIETDTLIIYGNTFVNFKFQCENQLIGMVKLLVDEEEIGTVYSQNGAFSILSEELSQGIHDLEMQIYTGSGTGSIAETLGAEGYIASKSWKLIVYYNYSSDVTFAVEDGLLHIRWNEFKASNFQEYVVYKKGDMSSRTEISRTRTNEFVDSSYVGEMTFYTIDVLTKGDEIFTNTSLSCSADLPELAFSVNDSNQYLLKWTRTKYYNAVDSILIFQGPINHDNASTLISSTRELNDTIYKLTNACFGDELDFKIRLVPKKNNVQYVPHEYYFYESRTWGWLGFPFKFMDYTPYCFPVKEDEFVFHNCDSITRYSVSAKRVMEKSIYTPSGCYTCSFVNVQGSNTGKYISAYVDCNRDLLITNGSNLNTHTIHKLQSITYGGYPKMAVSDSGTGIIHDSNGGFNLYDFRNAILLGHYEKNYTGDMPQALKISSDGKYFVIAADTLRLVQFSEAKFTDIWKVAYPNSIKYYEFDASNSNRIILWDGATLSVKQCNDMSQVRTFALNDTQILDIDYANDEFLSFTPGHLLVRSFLDGSLIRDIPVHFNPHNGLDTCYLIHHTIVYGRGLLYFIL